MRDLLEEFFEDQEFSKSCEDLQKSIKTFQKDSDKLRNYPWLNDLNTKVDPNLLKGYARKLVASTNKNTKQRSAESYMHYQNLDDNKMEVLTHLLESGGFYEKTEI